MTNLNQDIGNNLTKSLEESSSNNSEKEIKCTTCEDTGLVVENAGCCGGCDQCGSREEKEVPCPDCSLPEEDSEPLDD